MITVSLENYTEFYRYWQDRETNPDLKYLRLGQAFHNFMKLEKVKGHAKDWCDKLWATDDQTAFGMIQASIDYRGF
jgi:hypothetical protein